MSKPNFIPDSDWSAVIAICDRWKVDPYLIAAIGWHETHWGQLGAGKIGWILGYGYFPGSTVAEQYKGLYKQVEGACKQIARDMQLPITLVNVTNFAVDSWKSGAPRDWAKSVFSIYISIRSDYEIPVTDTEIVDLTKRVDTLELANSFMKALFIKLGKELENGR